MHLEANADEWSGQHAREDGSQDTEVVSEFAATLVSDPLEAGASESPLDAPLSSLLVLAAFSVGLSLKSVTYQPVPLRWKAVAETSLRKAAALQLGQSVSRGSLSP